MPLLQELHAGVDHGRADEEREGDDGAERADQKCRGNGQNPGHGEQGPGETEVMGQPVGEHQDHHRRHHQHLAR